MIIDENILKRAKEQALNYLSFRMRSQREIENYLKTKEYSDVIIELVIEMLYQYNYIDDNLFAKTYINQCITQKGWGKDKIFYELKHKGIDETIIEEQWEQNNISENEAIQKLLTKKIKNSKEMDFKEKRRIFNFLMRRGFSYDCINDEFCKYFSESLETD